jgi:hypothetical protein
MATPLQSSDLAPCRRRIANSDLTVRRPRGKLYPNVTRLVEYALAMHVERVRRFRCSSSFHESVLNSMKQQPLPSESGLGCEPGFFYAAGKFIRPPSKPPKWRGLCSVRYNPSLCVGKSNVRSIAVRPWCLSATSYVVLSTGLSLMYPIPRTTN